MSNWKKFRAVIVVMLVVFGFWTTSLYGAQVYGFTGWNKTQGYVSIHNPGDKTQSYTFTLDRKFGLHPDSGTFNLSSPILRCVKGLKKQYSYGDSITINIEPKGIIIINFDKMIVDWKVLRDLQK